MNFCSRQLSGDEALIMEREPGKVIARLRLMKSASLVDNEKLIKAVMRAYTKYTVNVVFSFSKDNR